MNELFNSQTRSNRESLINDPQGDSYLVLDNY